MNHRTHNIINLLLALPLLLLTLTSCHKKNDDEPEKLPGRTVIIYVCAENNLNHYFTSDYAEMLKGASSLTDDNLIVFIDRADSQQPPRIVRLDSKGEKTLYTFPTDFYATDPARMKEVFQWIVNNYPSSSYGLCFWGHANGIIAYTDTVASTIPVNAPRRESSQHRAYGYDSGNDMPGSNGIKWINIPTLASVLEQSLPRLDYVFFDCCTMQTAEVAYELRNACDLVIGSPAEIPGDGAPYDILIPDFFLPKDIVGRGIVDRYVNYYEDYYNNPPTTLSLWEREELQTIVGLPMSVISTSGMEALAHATHNALHTTSNAYYPNEIRTDSCIYYIRQTNISLPALMYDMRDVMRHNLTPENFAQWDKAYHEAVPYSRFPRDFREIPGKDQDWMTDGSIKITFGYFKINEDNYGGLSMFFPKYSYDYTSNIILNPNNSIYSYDWSRIVNWREFGWE